MFHMTWTTPCPIQGTLRLTRDPFRHGLGHYRDTEGNTWDVVGLIGGKNPYIQARPVGHHPNYYSTASSTGAGSPTGAGNDPINTWKPYHYTVVTQ